MADQRRQAHEKVHEKVQWVAHQAQDQAEGFFDKLKQHRPTGSQVLGLLTILTIGGTLLVLGGLAVTGTVITLIVLSPVLIIFSPVLIPAGFLLFLAVAGALGAGGVGIATVSAVSWLYNYFKGRHPPGSEEIEQARARIQETAEQARHKAAGFLQSKAQEAAPGA